ncbi:hypothetical protein [Massilia sp. erpn]|uniref:hypothetical protein n=1 Tax=Massilia sp. erpn TaxID=2738142 RepID=UPI002104C337|nr:hypothetical protein [Massilia sp. erpn]UTY57697.1 hypothetical protein HPQ68_11200 [Massilia sp. erpn]
MPPSAMPSFADTLAFFTSFKDLVPWIAIVLSIAAFWISILNYRRDRAKVHATSSYSEDWERFHASIYIDIVNAGRRPIILDTLVYAESKRGRLGIRRLANWIGVYFDYETGLALAERQRYRVRLKMDDLYQNSEDDMLEADDMWITDTLLHRHKIRDIKENIAKLKAWDRSQRRPTPVRNEVRPS